MAEMYRYGYSVHDGENSLSDLYLWSFFYVFFSQDLVWMLVSCWLRPMFADQALLCALLSPVKLPQDQIGLTPVHV